MLRYIHYGEGDYLECEQAIQELLLEIDDELELPAPLEPLRPEDAPGVALEPQTADIVLPRERDRLELVRDWTDGEDYIEASGRRRGRGLRIQRRLGVGRPVGLGRARALRGARTGGSRQSRRGYACTRVQFTPRPPQAPS